MRRLLLVLLLVASVLAVAPARAQPPDRVEAMGGVADAGSPAVAEGRRTVGIASAATGYWIATDDGGVQSFGGATFHGSAGGIRLASPVVGIAATPNRDGYWLVAADGGVFAFGAAPFVGSLGATPLQAPIVGMASAPDGGGYWLVARDGGVFSFGSATFAGSLGDRPPAAGVVGIASSPRGGYWLASADGGVYTFGGAPFLGSAGGERLGAPVASIAPTSTGRGYLLTTRDGGVYTYGDAPFHGAAIGHPEPVSGVALAGTSGYWLLRSPVPAVHPPLPPNSGTGRRIVYSNPGQRVWLVESDGVVIRSYLVSGKRDVPPAGTYSVFSKSRRTSAGHDGITMDDMVRFAHGEDLPIGFHGIPRDANGNPLQSDSDLGGFRSAGCVRQSVSDASFLFDWAPVGTTVVVTY